MKGSILLLGCLASFTTIEKKAFYSGDLPRMLTHSLPWPNSFGFQFTCIVPIVTEQLRAWQSTISNSSYLSMSVINLSDVPCLIIKLWIFSLANHAVSFPMVSEDREANFGEYFRSFRPFCDWRIEDYDDSNPNPAFVDVIKSKCGHSSRSNGS